MTLPHQPTLPGFHSESARVHTGSRGQPQRPASRTSSGARLARWASRSSTTVEWGNVVGGFAGQSFSETFATEGEAMERERQALAGEPVGEERAPLAVVRRRLDRWGGVTATTFPRAVSATP